MASQFVLLLSLLVIGVAFYSKPANALQMVMMPPEYELQEPSNAFLGWTINSANITRSSGVANSTIQNPHKSPVGKDVKDKKEITDFTGNMSMQDVEKVNVAIAEAFYSKSASAHQDVSDLLKADYKLHKFSNGLFGWPINSKNSTRSSGVANSISPTKQNYHAGKDEKAKNESSVTTRNISMENADGKQTNITNSQDPETPKLQMKKKKSSGHLSTVTIITIVVSSACMLLFPTLFIMYRYHWRPEWRICYQRSDSTSRPEPHVTFQNGKTCW
ncbi:unnamed protein product [Orchesella dallaii]|uniref:Uncharacterized protein n=1 Tax=Orchesella dallaii TaxID=48710 RepID=A0ABP1RAZ3_9HEXA